VRVERIDSRTSGRFVHVEVLPGVFTVVAEWMLDASACVGMEIGAPRVSVAALAEVVSRFWWRFSSGAPSIGSCA